jgi:16S rRNA (cytidine1402-2'-O)-methyltransferase
MLRRELNFVPGAPLLYLVATPIGNLGEMPPRSIEILKTMDLIACEDTRESGSLLKRFGIDKPLVSCHEHNEAKVSERLVALLREGKKVAYMSDAGYPCISDPGQRLAERCLKEGFKVSVLNGPSAALAALVGSGLPTDRFFFYGFLPSRPVLRQKELRNLSSFANTMIFYEAPHRIGATLRDMAKAFGGERRACLARELTKIHEEYIRGTLNELSELDEATLVGEIVVVAEGRKTEEKMLSDEDIATLLRAKMENLTPKDAIAAVSKEQGLPRNRVYEAYLSFVKKQTP